MACTVTTPVTAPAVAAVVVVEVDALELPPPHPAAPRIATIEIKRNVTMGA